MLLLFNSITHMSFFFPTRVPGRQSTWQKRPANHKRVNCSGSGRPARAAPDCQQQARRQYRRRHRCGLRRASLPGDHVEPQVIGSDLLRMQSKRSRTNLGFFDGRGSSWNGLKLLGRCSALSLSTLRGYRCTHPKTANEWYSLLSFLDSLQRCWRKFPKRHAKTLV